MKKVLLLAVLGITQAISAQVTQKLGDFTAVRVFDRISVTLVKSSENKIVINGTRAGDVEVVTKNRDLKVRMKLSKLLNGEDIEAIVYYSGVIDNVEASEGSFVGSQDTFKATAFELNAKEGANIKLNLDVARLKSKANSGGILEITGKATNHDLSITSGGIFKGRELSTTQTSVSISVGGEAAVYASEFVDAKTKAGGDINVYGDPKQVNQKTFAGGSINIKG
ncbi:head GIN domain-containing protein [Flavobacterium sp. RHBU_24]|uniref:head GIN domain-containing protein n=1 Tax=Flavobacterium sp. RHBU_24 TaxID=3391185 RepID=UPI003984B5A7